MKVMLCAILGMAGCMLTTARGDEAVKEAGGDADFVLKAAAAGLAEVNHAEIAGKQASSPAVKKFAAKMNKDHTKANKELLALANKKMLSAATRMDAAHQRTAEQLATLSGAAFDREYMAGQVKDHEEAVALFKKQSESGKDEDLKAWAKKTLPHLREHLKMAKETHDKLKSDKAGDR